ncbi:diacylglycerol kinase, partial [Klebsiella pneumoniae]|uniref:diacylglycerol kinase n=1 Tax=Klebsiella pneumoniae TaxID=573 RepID=UPI003EE3A3F2
PFYVNDVDECARLPRGNGNFAHFLLFLPRICMINQRLHIVYVLLVMIVEILNSAIEAVVDRIGSDFHELSGRAKDMGSAAVLLAIIIALITWGTLLWSHYH